VKFKKKIKLNNKRTYYAIAFITLLLTFKVNTIHNISNIVEKRINERIVQIYGFCDDESIGYLRYLKKKYKFSSNPKIINFNHNPQTNWSIFNTKKHDELSDDLILLNYPGKEINIFLNRENNNFYQLKDVYFYSLISKNIKSLSIDKGKSNIKDNLKIEIYLKDKVNKFKKIKDINFGNLIDKETIKQINFQLNNLNLGEEKMFFKIKNLTNKQEQKLILKIKLTNKFIIDDFDIIDNKNSCFYLK
jgi:hypothetical protein